MKHVWENLDEIDLLRSKMYRERCCSETQLAISLLEKRVAQLDENVANERENDRKGQEWIITWEAISIREEIVSSLITQHKAREEQEG